VVGFEETNLIGNVYYAHHVRWQGRCRELFLREHAPEVLTELAQGLGLATTHVSCDYFAELFALDVVVIRMSLEELTQSRMTMRFEYWRRRGESEELVARGVHQVACVRRSANGDVTAAVVPECLRKALNAYV
jgi:enediyne biosynthesis thioesterase